MDYSPYDFMELKPKEQNNSSDLDTARVSTTLAENTEKTSQRVLVDWVSVSFECASDLHGVFDLIGIEDFSAFEEKEGARYEFAGYHKTFKLGSMEIMCDEDKNMWLLNFSGEGCRQFELSSRYTIVELIGILIKQFATFNRLDIAIDDFENIFNTNMIRKAVFDKRCVTNLKEWGNHQRGLINYGDDILTMDSFYLGSKSSRYFLNVYDKKLEREQKNKEVEYESWTRTEIRFSYQYAQEFAKIVFSNPEKLGYHIKSFLKDKFTFLTNSSLKLDSNKSRLAQDNKNITRWWKQFLGKVERLKITLEIPDKTLDDTKDFLFEKASTSLAMLHLYDPVKYGELVTNLTSYGLGKMKKKHERKILNQFYLDEQIKKRTANDRQSKEKNFDITI